MNCTWRDNREGKCPKEASPLCCGKVDQPPKIPKVGSDWTSAQAHLCHLPHVSRQAATRFSWAERSRSPDAPGETVWWALSWSTMSVRRWPPHSSHQDIPELHGGVLEAASRAVPLTLGSSVSHPGCKQPHSPGAGGSRCREDFPEQWGQLAAAADRNQKC